MVLRRNRERKPPFYLVLKHRFRTHTEQPTPISLAYAAVLIVVDRADYKHLGWAWAVLAGMAAWTAFTSAAYAVPARRTRLLLAADLLVTAAALASTALLQYPASVAKAAMPVTATWVAGPVLAWAVAGGIRAGVVAALVLGACDLTLRHQSLAGVGGHLARGHELRFVTAAQEGLGGADVADVFVGQ